MTTAELLGNAALGIAALVAIWAVMQTLGLDVVELDPRTAHGLTVGRKRG